MKFNNLSYEDKLDIQKLVVDCMDTMGGRNYFLGMIEAVKEAKQHPMLNKTGKFHFPNGTISWGKEIYKDKVVTLKNMLIASDKDNILDCDNEKMKKNINNVIKTLGKLEFAINAKDSKEVTFKPFNTISDDNVELDPLFQIIFFDSLNNTKRILSYK
ncbi:MAG: hypothetical protein U9R39_02405 [Campylobacterota bacterium]|nr:hypothetical protein [Campylobacterota bacterium]